MRLLDLKQATEMAGTLPRGRGRGPTSFAVSPGTLVTSLAWNAPADEQVKGKDFLLLELHWLMTAVARQRARAQ